MFHDVPNRDLWWRSDTLESNLSRSNDTSITGKIERHEDWDCPFWHQNQFDYK